VICELKIAKANDRIEGLLKFAKMLPFTDTPEQVELLPQPLRDAFALFVGLRGGKADPSSRECIRDAKGASR